MRFFATVIVAVSAAFSAFFNREIPAVFSTTVSESTKLREAVFDPRSFWYERIPNNAPLNLNSANLAQELLRQIKTFYGHAAINTKAYSSPVYIVGLDTPTVRVRQWVCPGSHFDKQLQEMWRAVPIPSYAEPADGTDTEMTVYQPSEHTMWEFWRMQSVEGEWQACWGGRMLNVSNSDGIWQYPYGATATGLPFLGGQITPDELRRGAISHVMGVALVETENWNIYSWPANRSDGDNPTHLSNRIPAGMRFRLDPNIDVSMLAIHPLAKVIARAAQQYGFVVWDKAGAVSLRADNPKAYTGLGMPTPYAALWNGTPSNKILDDFPWGSMQFLPMNYGQ